MICYFTYLFATWIFWILFFVLVQKPLFLFYNYKLAKSVCWCFKDWKNIYLHGFYSDVIASSWLMILPTLLFWLHIHLPAFDLCGFITVTQVFLSLIVALVVLSDTALYKFREFKLDGSVLIYLRNPKAAFASVNTFFMALIITIIIAFALLIFVCQYAIAMWFCPFDVVFHLPREYVVCDTFFILIIFLLFVITRGIHKKPNFPGIAYWSGTSFKNHCALNPLYNLLYSLPKTDKFEGLFQEFDKKTCENIIAKAFPISGNTEIKLLNTCRPNILLIVWESLCARYMSSLNGRDGILENMDKLAEEGVLFTRCDASSIRTERGLVCLLAGLPAPPTTSITQHINILPHLPALPRRFKSLGYNTLAVHGGDCKVMNKQDWYKISGHDTIIQWKDLPNNAPTGSSWGVNDDWMLDLIYEDIIVKTKQKEKWFTTFQTLSSHEPFNVPYNKLENPVLNAFSYVDNCIGTFVDKLKNTSAWDNLLIIITADHGNKFDDTLCKNNSWHIPLLMVGGAIKCPMRIDKIMSQTDLAATLLAQMNLSHEEFTFSRDILADTYTNHFSFHTYQNGFILRDKEGFTDYDCTGQKVLCNHNEERERVGKAILQKVYADLAQYNKSKCVNR